MQKNDTQTRVYAQQTCEKLNQQINSILVTRYFVLLTSPILMIIKLKGVSGYSCYFYESVNCCSILLK